MKRNEYNRDLLEHCIEFLRSKDPNRIYEGVVLSAYLIEQVFKLELRRINPLLYFDRNGVTTETEVDIVLGKLSDEKIKLLKTIKANKCIDLICEYKKDLKPHKTNFEELFNLRNYIVHSIDDIFSDSLKASAIAVSALNICKKYFSDNFIDVSDILTSNEFDKLQNEKSKKYSAEMKDIIKKHKLFFEELHGKEVERRIKSFPETDKYTWVETTSECPACGQESFDKIGNVDFDWNPDGIITSAFFYYVCRVCHLNLSEYEYEDIINQG